MFVEHMRGAHRITMEAIGSFRLKTEEEGVSEYLRTKEIPFGREPVIDLDCAENTKGRKYYRVDFLMRWSNKIIIVEINEFQHRYYPVSCESIRPIRTLCTTSEDFMRKEPDVRSYD